jgi:hypothetical protein
VLVYVLKLAAPPTGNAGVWRGPSVVPLLVDANAGAEPIEVINGAGHNFFAEFTILGRLAESAMDAQRYDRLQRTAPRQVAPEGTSSGKLRQ